MVNVRQSCILFTESLMAVSFIDGFTSSTILFSSARTDLFPINTEAAFYKFNRVGVAITFTFTVGVANVTKHVTYCEQQKTTLYSADKGILCHANSFSGLYKFSLRS